MMIVNQYDTIAKEYDSLFVDDKSLAENKAVARMLSAVTGSILDVGCGTGLLLDLLNIPCEKYLGVDSSSQMVAFFREKYPLHDVLTIPFELLNTKYLDFKYFVALFGSVSYIEPDALSEIPQDKKLFLMFYREDYHPVTYEKTDCEFSHFKHTKQDLQERFPCCEIKEFNNYYIVTNL